MSRGEQVLEVMHADLERDWTSTEMSVALCCAPAQARQARSRLVDAGRLVIGRVGLYRLADAPPPAPDPKQVIHDLLTRTPTLEWTPHGVATEPLGLELSEDRALDHLIALWRAGHIELWACLPTPEEAHGT